jgi:hypothetical protein
MDYMAIFAAIQHKTEPSPIVLPDCAIDPPCVGGARVKGNADGDVKLVIPAETPKVVLVFIQTVHGIPYELPLGAVCALCGRAVFVLIGKQLE